MSQKIVAVTLAVAVAVVADAAAHDDSTKIVLEKIGQQHLDEKGLKNYKQGVTPIQAKKNVVDFDEFVDKLVERVLPDGRADLDNVTLVQTHPSSRYGTLRASPQSRPLPFVPSSRFLARRYPFSVPRAASRSLPLSHAASESFGASKASAMRYPIRVAASEKAMPINVAKLKEIFVKRYLPIVLTFLFVVGLTFPQIGKDLAAIKIGTRAVVPSVACAWIFFIQGTRVNSDEIKRAVVAVPPLLYGILMTVVITPLMSIPISFLTFLREEFRTGLILLCNMATTKSAGTALTGLAGGSFAFGLMLSVTTNVLAIFTAPTYLSWLMPASGGLQKLIELRSHGDVPILPDIIYTIILPTLAGKAVVAVPWISKFLNRWKTPITFSCLTGTATIPYLKLSQSAEVIYSLGVGSVLMAGVVVSLMNIVFLVGNFFATGLLRYPMEIRKALILLCSQKTMPVAMVMLTFMPDSIGNHGIIAIPMILWQIVELFLGSFVATKMASWVIKESDSSKSAEGGSGGTAVAAIQYPSRTPSMGKAVSTKSL